MIVTVEEAKKLWCPFVRHMSIANTGASGCNRVSDPARNGEMSITKALCIADRCMMWTWIGSDWEGYCGLTRQP